MKLIAMTNGLSVKNTVKEKNMKNTEKRWKRITLFGDEKYIETQKDEILESYDENVVHIKIHVKLPLLSNK